MLAFFMVIKMLHVPRGQQHKNYLLPAYEKKELVANIYVKCSMDL
jgi:hypothetical protein